MCTRPEVRLFCSDDYSELRFFSPLYRFRQNRLPRFTAEAMTAARAEGFAFRMPTRNLLTICGNAGKEEQFRKLRLTARRLTVSRLDWLLKSCRTAGKTVSGTLRKTTETFSRIHWRQNQTGASACQAVRHGVQPIGILEYICPHGPLLFSVI
jgi:hypothetical protein